MILTCSGRTDRPERRARRTADVDARTEAEACDPGGRTGRGAVVKAWPATLAVVREVDPEGAEALAPFTGPPGKRHGAPVLEC